MHEARDHLALALDLDDLGEAERLTAALAPWFGVAKVGLELYSAAGPLAVTRLHGLGPRVFCDLKLHDIPTTVQRAARVLGALGASFVTLHTSGGVAMLAAGVEGLREGALRAGHPAPVALGVTVLTSDPVATPGVLAERVAAAAEAGCGGVVCAAGEVELAKQVAPQLLAVVPGIRPAGAARHDQARAATPAQAVAAGADLLVVGRAVTAATDPQAAARAIAGEVAGAFERRGPGPAR